MGELKGLLGAVGFDRGRAAKLEEHSENFARFARGIDNKDAGREFHATGLRAIRSALSYLCVRAPCRWVEAGTKSIDRAGCCQKRLRFGIRGAMPTARRGHVSLAQAWPLKAVAVAPIAFISLIAVRWNCIDEAGQ